LGFRIEVDDALLKAMFMRGREGRMVVKVKVKGEGA